MLSDSLFVIFHLSIRTVFIRWEQQQERNLWLLDLPATPQIKICTCVSGFQGGGCQTETNISNFWMDFLHDQVVCTLHSCQFFSIDLPSFCQVTMSIQQDITCTCLCLKSRFQFWRQSEQSNCTVQGYRRTVTRLTILHVYSIVWLVNASRSGNIANLMNCLKFGMWVPCGSLK